MIKIIAAMDENRLIGIRGGAMPWGRGLKDDLKRFKELTTGHAILMGRKTFMDDIKRALPNRTNIILTRDPNFRAEGCIVTNMLPPVWELEPSDPEHMFVIGGAEIYALALPHASELYLTRVHGKFEGDVYFPDLDEAEWTLQRSQLYEKSDRNTHAFTTQDWVWRK
jgi:dihydrofolate reductase